MRGAANLRLIASLVLVVGLAGLITVWLLDVQDSRSRPQDAQTTVTVAPPAAPAPVPAVPTPDRPPPQPTEPPTVPTTPTEPPAVRPGATVPPTVPGPLPPPITDPVGVRCFGAASVDPVRGCRNDALRGTVFPTPLAAGAAQSSGPCRRRFDRGLLRICFWGATARNATRTIAVVGDSHSSHWRAAMQTVVDAKGWRAISISRAACPLTLAMPDLPGVARKVGCRAWNLDMQAYLRARPSITAVFVGAHRGRVLAAPGQSMQSVRLAGYLRAWRRLLARHVRHIVVFRDTPRIRGVTLRCIDAALAAGQPAGDACALPRSYALPPDPQSQAARLLPQYVQVADLAPAFCDARVCRPVIGGALVLRDVSHMTTTYSKTLGPYLLRTINRITRSWRDGRRPGT